MAKYECKQCGDTALSKCARRRSVFPDDGEATLLRRMIRAYVGRPKATGIDGAKMYTVVIHVDRYPLDDDDETSLGLILGAIERLRKHDVETVKRAVCVHEWEIVEGECDFGCCRSQSQAES